MTWTCLRGVNLWLVATQSFFIFTLQIGEDEPILTNIFQRGWRKPPTVDGRNLAPPQKKGSLSSFFTRFDISQVVGPFFFPFYFCFLRNAPVFGRSEATTVPDATFVDFRCFKRCKPMRWNWSLEGLEGPVFYVNCDVICTFRVYIYIIKYIDYYDKMYIFYIYIYIYIFQIYDSLEWIWIWIVDFYTLFRITCWKTILKLSTFHLVLTVYSIGMTIVAWQLEVISCCLTTAMVL